MEEMPLSEVVDSVRNQGNPAVELEKLYNKKEAIEAKLVNLEKQIYALEGSYLQDTRYLGNILTGWDLYLSQRSGAIKRPQKFRESDRLFSLSSVTSVKVPTPHQQQVFFSRAAPHHLRKNVNELKLEKESTATTTSQGLNNNKLGRDKKQGPGRPRKMQKTYDDDEYVDV